MTAPSRNLIWETEDGVSTEPRLTRPVVYGLLAFSVTVLGMNWPVMVTALKSITPIWLAAFRVAGAAVFALILTASTGKLAPPVRRDMPMMVVLTVFRLCAVMVLVFFALKLVPAGRASVLVWTSSLWTVPIAAVFLGERMSRPKWLGVGVGIAGVIVISQIWGNDWSDRDVIVGTTLLLLAALVSSATTVFIRRHQWKIDPLEALPWQFLGGTALLVTLALLVEGAPDVDWSAQLVLIILYQAVPASGLAFWAQILVLRNLSAVSMNLTMMGVPVLGVLSSAVFLDESITAGLTLGIALVFCGVAVNLLSDDRTDRI
ncbi:MAG: DMT family transporter [Acidimicrobiales bacterium]